MNCLILGRCLLIKSFRETMKGSLARNSTKFARFCTAFVTSFKVLSATKEGVSVGTEWSLPTDRDTLLNHTTPVAIKTHSLYAIYLYLWDKEVLWLLTFDSFRILELWNYDGCSSPPPNQVPKGQDYAASRINLSSNCTVRLPIFVLA